MNKNLIQKALSLLLVLASIIGCSKTDQLNPVETTPPEDFKVSKQEALKLATASNAPANARTSGEVSKKVKEMKEFKENRGKTVFYAINYEDNKGFLLLSADRRMTPVLAYSDEGSFNLDTDNPGIQLWKDLVSQSYKGVEKNTKAHRNVVNEWKYFEKKNAGNGRTTDQPVWTPEASCEYFVTHPIPTNVTIQHLTDQFSRWRQGTGYNYYCPSNSILFCNNMDCGKTNTSCGAVAVGQVLRYHRKPITANGRSFTTAMFNAMPPTLSSSNCDLTVESHQNIAHLLRDVGADLDVHYNTANPLLGGGFSSGSGCQSWNLPTKIDDFFNSHGYISNEVDFWGLSGESTIREHLLASRPVILFGAGCTTCLGSAHIWVIDGVQDLNAIYQDQSGYCYHHRVTLYQMNWGWGNASENSGWFNYTSITGDGTVYDSANMKAYTVVP